MYMIFKKIVAIRTRDLLNMRRLLHHCATTIILLA